MSAQPETTKHGSAITRRFCGPDADRYRYDFTTHTPDKGWQQYDTEQDASYFGVWVHAADRVIVCFAEGDETTTASPTAEAFRAELAALAAFHGPPPPSMIVIDADGSVTHHFDTRPTGDDRGAE